MPYLSLDDMFAGRPDLRENFARRIREHVREDESGCWIWTGYVGKNGYGRVCTGAVKGFPKRMSAHKAAYLNAFGEISEGCEIRHKCKGGKLCENPDHLYARRVVPPAEVAEAAEFMRRLP